MAASCDTSGSSAQLFILSFPTELAHCIPDLDPLPSIPWLNKAAPAS